jgi:hypothetical protein
MSIRITALTHLALPFVGLLALAGSCNSSGGDLESGTGGDESGGRGAGGRGGNAGSGGSHSGGTSGGNDSGGQSGGGGIAKGGSGGGGAGKGGSAGAPAGGAGGGSAGSGGRTSGGGQGGVAKDAGTGGTRTSGDGGVVACDDIESPGRLAVYYYSNSKASDSSIQMHFDIVNYTAYTSRLQDLSVKYWFTDEDPSSANVLEQYYVPIATTFKFSTVNPPRTGANAVLEMSFRNAPDAGISWVETKGFNLAFHKSSYAGSYDQTDDYSYDPKLLQALGKNPKITAYVNGTLAWGCEPPPLPPGLDAGTPSELDGGEEVDAPVVVRDARTPTPDARQGG